MSAPVRYSDEMVRAMEPEGYVKPPIEVDGFALRWNEVSFGIASDEESELRTFIRGALPIIPKIVSGAKSMQREGERERHLRRHELHYAYTPVNVLSHSAKHDASYEIYVNWDGILSIDRVEEVSIVHDGQPDTSYSLMKLKWNLGELERAGEAAR